jgi:TRAP-type transport system periplasmic protein
MNHYFRQAAACFSRFALAFALISASFAQSPEPRVIRVAYAVAQNSHYGAGVDAFARELAELTNNRFKVEHLGGGKAGGELEILNKVKAGELEMGNTSTGPLGNIVPEAKVFDLPFLFSDYNHARKTLDSRCHAEIRIDWSCVERERISTRDE